LRGTKGLLAVDPHQGRDRGRANLSRAEPRRERGDAARENVLGRAVRHGGRSVRDTVDDQLRRIGATGMIRWAALLGAAMGLTVAPRARDRAPSYDLVAAHGRVRDPESGLDAVRHVGIRGGKIAAVSESPLRG